MISFHEIWGTGHGVISQLSPRTRIISCCIVLASCLISPAYSWSGTLFIIVLIVSWNRLCRVPGRINLQLLTMTAIMILPVVLLVPWINTTDISGSVISWKEKLAVSWNIMLRCWACLYASTAGIASIRLNEFHHAVYSFPIPRTISFLIVQIIHQTILLAEESGRIMRAVRIRGGCHSLRKKIQVIFFMPVVWLLRILNKAHRVSLAMIVRGETIPYHHARSENLSSGNDWFALLASAAILSAAIAIRWKSV